MATPRHTHRLGGDVSSALSHLMLVGIASILEDAGVRPVRLAWRDQRPLRPTLDTSIDALEVSGVVQALARRHLTPTSWVQATVDQGKRKGSGLFSPRVAVPPADEWSAYETQRSMVLNRQEDLTGLDRRMIAALGEPAWWHPAQDQPDRGASRWEMKTRNRGEEFITGRLQRLAQAVADRSPEDIWAGLSGESVVDETGSGIDSRTSTGLTVPGPCDSAQAWCALWGLSALRTVHVSTERVARGFSQSAGTWPRSRVAPARHALLVFSEPASLAAWRALMSSKQFDDMVRSVPKPELAGVEPDARRRAAAAWLKGHGVKAVVTFPVRVTGSSSAPERQLLAGELEVL